MTIDAYAAGARALLSDLFARHDRVFLAFSGGKESLALARLCEPWAGRFRLLWANTGYAFPHVEAMIRAYGERFGLEERRSDLLANWRANGMPSDIVPIPNALPEGYHAEPRLQAWPACCGALRSGPLLHMLQSETERVAVIHGQRIEDRAAGLGMSGWAVPPHVEVVAPLADWSTADVMAYLGAEGVDLPAHYGEVADSLDCWVCPSAFGEAKGPARAAYMAKAYPDLLALVMPAVRRTRDAVVGSAGRLDRSIHEAASEGMAPVLQSAPDAGDCLIAALATVLGRSYAETAHILGVALDPSTGGPTGIDPARLAFSSIAAPLLAVGISSTILFSDRFASMNGQAGGHPADQIVAALQGRRAVVMVEDVRGDRRELHALAWDGSRLMDCRGLVARWRAEEPEAVLAAAIVGRV